MSDLHLTIIKSHNEPTLKESYAVTTHDTQSKEKLAFDPHNSVALCVGIRDDYDGTNDDFRKVIENDVTNMVQVFETQLGINTENIKVKIDCTKQGLHDLFVECAETVVEQNAIFIFYFSGHGSVEENDYFLVPAGPGKVSHNDLMEWLTKASCKAKNVLFIFDCCHAGGIGELLANPVTNITPRLSIMCSCKAQELSIAVSILQNSLFTFFLWNYLIKCQPLHGQFDVKEIIEGIIKLCTSLSSLIYIYQDQKLAESSMSPTFYQQKALPKIQSAQVKSTLEAIIRQNPNSAEIPSVVKEWIKSEKVCQSLSDLSVVASSSECLQNTIVCVLFQSSAYLLYEKDKNLNDDIMVYKIALMLVEYEDCLGFEFDLQLGIKSYNYAFSEAKTIQDIKGLTIISS